jgi:hypothetical protein
VHGFKKVYSLFQKGMKPYGKQLEEPDSAWRPFGTNVRYFRDELRSPDKKLKTLTKNASS